MRFSVLGPLTVTGESGPVDIRAAKQRSLLAVLLTQPGRAVPSDRLANALWGDDPPSSVDKSLAWHVHKLRKALGPGDRVSRAETGYQITLRSGELDSRRFEELYRAGSAAEVPARTAELFAEALRLWRGRAFGDVAEIREVRGTAHRLNDLRLSALEQRVDADLALGRHGELIGELTTLVDEHAFKESFRGQLMLALYRSGRQADALRIYREGRERMVAELGIEPGNRLRRLEQAILRNSSELDLPAPVRRAPQPTADRAVPPPAELPPAVAGFTGRDAEMERVCELLTRDPRAPAGIPVITGSGGTGKSTLAVHVAHRIAEGFPDGQLYVNLHGATPQLTPVDPAAVLARFLRSLEANPSGGPADVDELAGRFRSATAHKRLLVVLDDARDAAQVRPLLPAGSGCRVIVTSRHPLASLDGAVQHRLSVLPEDEARLMLERALFGRGDDPEELGRLAHLCGCLPLALSVAAARLNRHPNHPISTIIGQLAAEHRRLSILKLEDRDVRASFMVSYRGIDDPAQASMFRLSGLHPGADIGLPVAAAMAGVNQDDAYETLETLVDAGLMESPAPQRYRTHDLLRLFARELAAETESETERRTAEMRALRCYLAIARHALEVHSTDLHPTADPRMAEQFQLRLAKRIAVPPRTGESPVHFGSDAESAAWIDTEFDNLLAVIRRAARSADDGDMTGAAALPAVLQPLVTRYDRLKQLGEFQHQAAEIADRDGIAAIRYFAAYDTAVVLLLFDDFPAAMEHIDRALVTARQQGDAEWEALALLRQADAFQRADRIGESIASLRRCLELAREAPDEVHASGPLIGLATAYRRTGRTAEAVDALRSAITVARDEGHHYHRAEALNELGVLYIHDGKPAAAADLIDEALAIANDTGALGPRMQALFLWSKAEALLALDRDADARAAREESVNILLDLHVLDLSEARTLLARQRPDMPAVLRL